MATKPAFKSTPIRTALDVFLGRVEQPMGRLIFVKDGAREFSQFAYSEAWLADAQYFDISPDLTRQAGYQLRKPPTKNDSCFFLALADTGSVSAAPVWMFPAAVTLPQPTGVAATDTAAIQNAENALNALGGGAIVMVLEEA